jgi:pyrrolidone-carboxylate peptidase
MSILLTAFEKFSKYEKNLSEQLVSKFPENFNHHSIEKLIIPVKWEQSWHSVRQRIENVNVLPTLFVLTGIQEARNISIEDRAFNFRFGLDEERHFKCGLINIKDGLWLKSNVNVKHLLKRLKFHQKIRVSVYAGVYLCNYIYYLTLKYYKRDSYVLFVHFPKAESFSICFRVLKSIIFNLISMYNS